VPFLAGDAFTIADIANYAYTHVAPEMEIPLDGYPAVRAGVARGEAQPGFVNDLEPHPH
jgi:glutathione S-transferase